MPSYYHAKNRYGLDKEALDELLSKPCGVCGRSSEVVDHDHESGVIRQGLCRSCNVALGHLRDSPLLCAKAYAYLIRHSHLLRKPEEMEV